LREHLKIDRWQVFGGSWGSTLALAYSQKHPERCTELVLRGIFLCRRFELEWFYQNDLGAAALFPDFWERYLKPLSMEERKDCMQSYYKRLTSDNRETLLEAARAWSVWESALAYMKVNQNYIKQAEDPKFAAAFARIECHYFVNGAFPRAPEPAHRRCSEDPPHPGGHRAGTLRRRLPDAQRLGSAHGLARGGPAHRSGCGTLGVRASISRELVLATDRFQSADASRTRGKIRRILSIRAAGAPAGERIFASALKFQSPAPLQLLAGTTSAPRRDRRSMG
jgi:hypothetical protein